MPDQAAGIGLPLICNLMTFFKATAWLSVNYYNQEWGEGLFNNSYSMINVAWVDSIDPRPAYFPRSPINSPANQCHFHDELPCRKRQEHLCCQYNWRNILVNPRVHCRGQDTNGPVTQLFLSRIPVASVSNCFVPVDSVINCLRILCKIILCVTRGGPV